MKKWKVKYQDLRALKAKHPFYNQEEIVEAETRQQAIDKVKNDWHYFGHYGNYKASIIRNEERSGCHE